MRPRIVIIGAGFGGLFTARKLAKQDVEIIIIDRNNYHTFTPLIYQVATCGLDVEDVAYPVRKIFAEHDNVFFLLGNVEGVTPDANLVTVRTNGNTRDIEYDYLIVAAGSETNYFGNANIKQHAFGLKTLEDAVLLRNHILRMVEKADWAEDETRLKALTTIVVVGGGPTGLETAGAMYELYNNILRSEYNHLKTTPVRVILVELQEYLLSPYPPRLRESARTQLEQIGVEVVTGTGVAHVEEGSVHLNNGEVIASHTLVWATGVKASPLAQLFDVELARGGRLPVERTMQVSGLGNVYAVGDIAYIEDEDGNPYPQLIPVAQQQAKLLVNNVVRRIKGQPEESFTYFDKGSMATIGRNHAVAWVFNRVQLTGFVAWISWLALHLLTLMGFRNRLVVLINWIWNYLVYDRAARVILDLRGEEEEEQVLPAAPEAATGD
ncbi:MAG: NAD(P)/FAD-dependent oxidoreductase [Chloroflexota bacterium]